MKTRPNRLAILAAGITAMTLSGFAQAGGEGWIRDDYDKALKTAAEKDLPILIDFTGSDWCGWCIKLNEEVFSQSLFKEEAPKKFVLLELDFPTDKVPQTDEVKAKNKKLNAKYGIQGYPTILLTDAKGVVFAKTGYRPNGPGPYMEFLNSMLDGKQKRDDLLGKAKTAEGLERAKLLDQAMSIKDIMVPTPIKMMEQIITLDAENEAGLKTKYETKLATAKAEKMMGDIRAAMGEENGAKALELIAKAEANGLEEGRVKDEIESMKGMALAMDGRIDEAFKMLDEKIAAMTDATPDQIQQAMIGKFQIAMQSGDVALVNKVLDEVVAVAPDSQMSTMIEQQRPMIIADIEKRAKDAKDG